MHVSASTMMSSYGATCKPRLQQLTKIMFSNKIPTLFPREFHNYNNHTFWISLGYLVYTMIYNVCHVKLNLTIIVSPEPAHLSHIPWHNQLPPPPPSPSLPLSPPSIDVLSIKCLLHFTFSLCWVESNVCAKWGVSLRQRQMTDKTDYFTPCTCTQGKNCRNTFCRYH